MGSLCDIITRPTGRLMSSSRISQIALPTPFRVGPVNAYLIEGDPLTLVDTGPNWAGSLRALELGLEQLGYPLSAIEQIVLTHQHFDHFGLAAHIHELSGARVAAIEPLARYLADFPNSIEQDDVYAERVMLRYSTPRRQIDAVREITRSFWRFGERVHVDLPFREDELVSLGGRAFRVLARPGHSPTDTIFVDEQAGVALVGDHLLPTISSNPVLHRPVDDDDLERREPTLARYLDSLRETDALDLETVFPGHGGPTSTPRALIHKRIQEHEDRKELIFRLLSERPLPAHELAKLLWGDVEDSQVYLAVSEIVGHTDLLIREDRVRESRLSDGTLVFEQIASAALRA